jgi:hypothetical protein
MTNPKFTVCVLLYGDFLNLARRCLEPLFKLRESGLVDLRLGLNEVSQPTRDYIKEHSLGASQGIDVWLENPQVYKYPMMRQMFHSKPIETPYVMWFDDDSYVKDASLLTQVETQMVDCDMLGSVYTIPYGNDQKEWCKSQPWYVGKPLSDKPRFATGGWWCIKTDVLKRFDWPTPELKHCGGDVALGILISQNDLKLKHFNKGVAINANAQGKESAAERRGASKTEKPIGKGFTKLQ